MEEVELGVAEHEAADEAVMQSSDLREGFDGWGGSGGNQTELDIVTLHGGRQRRRGSKAARDRGNK